MLDGGMSIVTSSYDLFGRISRRSVPYIAGETDWSTSYSYDTAGRLTQISRRVSESVGEFAVTSFDHQGLAVIATDPLNRHTTVWRNPRGQVVRVVDAANAGTDYEYDAFGNLLSIMDVQNNETRMTYNTLGMKLTSSDPDMGDWSYDYFPFGELRSQTDAKAQVTRFTYDALSRPLTRLEPEGTTTWTWDTAVKGTGQLASVSSPGGYVESYVYDDYARLARRDMQFDAGTYSYDYAYNASTGFLQELTYPASVGDRFKISYDYDNGLLWRIKDFNSPATVYWQANAANARHQVTSQQLGDDLQTFNTYDRITGRIDRIDTELSDGSAPQQLRYTWDVMGNLSRREDLNQGTLAEDFTYDALNRLDIVRRNGAITQDTDYDLLGNITSKTGVGAYAYHPEKIHAVVSAGSHTYGYDANGNMITRPDGGSIAWTSYNLPQAITQISGIDSTFFYGPDRQRYKQVQTGALDGNSSSVMTTRFAGNLFEAIEFGSNDSFRHYVVANGGAVAVVVRTPAAAQSVEYLTTDHLGSTDALYPASGTTADARFSNDAWGQRRDWDWDGPPQAADVNDAWTVTSRGFTGHGHLDNQDLIHMGGRVYDPVISRFVSPDPTLQLPLNGQNLNRYSYALNNPLRYVDPSGFSLVDGDIEFNLSFTGWADFILGRERHTVWTNCKSPTDSDFCRNILSGNLDVIKECGLDAACLARLRQPQLPTPTDPAPQPDTNPSQQPTLPAADTGMGGLGRVQGSTVDGPGSLDQVTRYIYGEMITNATGNQVRFIRSFLSRPATIGQGVANWKTLVDGGAIWDHKPALHPALPDNPNQTRFRGTQAPFYAQDTGAPAYSYEIWSNIHYGYVGMSAGFSADVLLDGAGTAQLEGLGRRLGGIVRNGGFDGMRRHDTAIDQAAIGLGIHLYTKYGLELTVDQLRSELEMWNGLSQP